jgi:hypothetical protein
MKEESEGFITPIINNALGLIGQVFTTNKVSLGLIVLSVYLGVKYHEPIQRTIDYVLNHNIVVEKNFFQDPRGLAIKLIKNYKGRREVYLSYKDKNIPIYEDLLPGDDYLIQCLEQRAESYDKKSRNILEKKVKKLYGLIKTEYKKENSMFGAFFN